MANPGTASIEMIQSLQSWVYALQKIRGFGICGLDIDATGQDPLVSKTRLVLLALPSGQVYVADMLELGKKALDDLSMLMEDGLVKKVIHNAKMELSFIRTSQGRRPRFRNIFDVLLASQISWSGYYDLAPSKSSKNPWKKRIPDHSLKALAERHLGIILGESSQICDWSSKELTSDQICQAAMEAYVLLPIYDILQELIIKNGLGRIADLEFRTLSPVVEMELSGICLDIEAAKALIAENEAQLIKVFVDIQRDTITSGFIPASKGNKETGIYMDPECPEEIKRYLRHQGFDILSTRAEVLKDLVARGCVFADMLLNYRRIGHQLAFLDHWLQDVHPIDRRIHPGYFQLQSATGRLSSRRPNAQQVPKRGEDGTAMRKLFIAPPGKKLIEVDFSGIELRIMAYLSGDEIMLKAFQEGQDLHRLTASRISGIPLDQVTPEQRQAAKTINFLLIYGGSAETLQRLALFNYGAFMTIDEVREAREKFFETYPGVRDWQNDQLEALNCTHLHYFHDCVHGTFSLPLTCTFTALGRRRVWPRFGAGIRATKFQAYNTPSQGTGADLIKMVMCELYDRLTDEDARIIASIHDEILMEVPEEKAEEYAKMLQELMNRIGSELLYPVPVTSEAKILSSWGG